MPQPTQYKELYENKTINQFLKENELDKDKRYKRNYISVIGRYLTHRNLSITEYISLLKNYPKDEISKVHEYRAFLKGIGKADQTPYIKRLMRFFGITFPRYKQQQRKKRILYYIDDVADKYMIEFMELQKGLSGNSQRRINRSLYEFCQFVSLSPSELYQQVITEELDRKKLGRLIIDFSLSRENPTMDQEKSFGWKPISHEFTKTKTYYINQFFEMVCLAKPVYKSSQLGKSDNGMNIAKRALIKKMEIRQVSEKMNLNQKCLFFGLFESGLYAKDLVNLTYGKIKHALDLNAALENTRECVAFFNRRSKTRVGHIAVIGKQTLYYLQLKLSERIRMYSSENPYQIKDDEFVFSENISPMREPNPSSVNNMIRDKSLSCGFEKITCRDLRRTFITLLAESAKIPIEHRQILYGHLNKLMSTRAYTVSDFPKYEEFYSRSYNECFFLEYDDVKYKSLQKEMQEVRENFETIMEKLLGSLMDSKGDTNLTREDLEKALRRSRKIE